jgi:hypothetical protein
MVKLIDPDFTAVTATGQSPPKHTAAKKTGRVDLYPALQSANLHL